MKKIGLDIREFKKGRMTGIGRFIKNFIVYACEIKKDWEFLLFGNQDTLIPFDLPNNSNVKIIAEGNTQIWEQIKLPLFLHKIKCDLFFSPYYKTPILTNIPSVITIHDLIHLTYPDYNKSFYLEKQLSKIYSAKASAIITDSENSKKDIVKILKVNAEKIFVIYNAIDTSFFNPERNSNDFENIAKKYSIKKPYLLYVGNSKPHKNVNKIYQAYKLLPKSLKVKYMLVLSGVGDYDYPICLDKDSLSVIPRVEEEEIALLYSNASLFVFPSFYEGFGFPPLEAMACGCPVISSNASCMPEILGDSCLYFNPDDSKNIAKIMDIALTDKSLRFSLTKKGLEQVKKYAPEKVVNNILGVFEKIKQF